VGPLYVATGTSDIGQYNPLPNGKMGPAPAAFPIYWSRDLATWYFANYIFPRIGHLFERLAFGLSAEGSL
jgi:hypothetical protein